MQSVFYHRKKLGANLLYRAGQMYFDKKQPVFKRIPDGFLVRHVVLVTDAIA